MDSTQSIEHLALACHSREIVSRVIIVDTFRMVWWWFSLYSLSSWNQPNYYFYIYFYDGRVADSAKLKLRQFNFITAKLFFDIANYNYVQLKFHWCWKPKKVKILQIIKELKIYNDKLKQLSFAHERLNKH